MHVESLLLVYTMRSNKFYIIKFSNMPLLIGRYPSQATQLTFASLL